MKASGTAAGCAQSRFDGISAINNSCVTTYCACAPPPSRPNTRCPGFHFCTPAPVSAISPANSIPGISAGNPGGGGYLPCRCSRSARFRAVARTRTNTWSGATGGFPTSRTSSTSGPPKEGIHAACMVLMGGPRGYEDVPWTPVWEVQPRRENLLYGLRAAFQQPSDSNVTGITPPPAVGGYDCLGSASSDIF